MPKPINTKTLEDARTGFQVLFDGTFSSYLPLWSKVAMEQKSTTARETYAWLGEMAELREWVGDRVVHGLKEHDYSIVNKDFELTIGVARNHIADDTVGNYTNRFKMMGEKAAQHPDKMVFDLLKRGHQTLCYDGQNFFDTDHPVLDEEGEVQSVSNSFTGGGPAWFLLSTRSVIKPIIYQTRQPYEFVALDDPRDANVFWKKEFVYGVDGRSNVGFSLWQLATRSTKTLDKAGYKEARDAHQGRKGEGGAPLGLTADLLVVNQANEQAALEVIKAERDAYGATNVYQGTTEVFVCPWL